MSRFGWIFVKFAQFEISEYFSVFQPILTFAIILAIFQLWESFLLFHQFTIAPPLPSHLFPFL